MENLHSESGYGFNENGTERSRDDYHADHEHEESYSTKYEDLIRSAEEEENDEIRALYPGEYDEAENLIRSAEEEKENESGSLYLLREAVKEIKAMNARLDAILDKFKAARIDGSESPKTVDSRKIGNASLNASATDSKSPEQPKVQSSESLSDLVVDRKSGFVMSREEAIGFDDK